MSQPSVTVIGTGALGSTLTKALYREDYSISSLYNRSLKKAETLSKEVEANCISTFPSAKKELGILIFITVQDSEIAGAVLKLSELADNFEGFYVIHCSGNEPADILKPVQKKGAKIAAFHPLQTFTSNSAAEDFKDIYFDIEADREVAEILQDIASSLGSKTLNISKEAKPYLHAAAVVASNYLVTLLSVSGRIAELGKIDQNKAIEALLPLVRKSLQNIESEHSSQALTGPIIRGDVETVRTHLQLLKHDKDLLMLYKKLGLQTLHLADRSKRFSVELKAELRTLLE